MNIQRRPGGSGSSGAGSGGSDSGGSGSGGSDSGGTGPGSGGSGRDPLDVLTRVAREPDLVLSYGDGADRVADVRLPPSAFAEVAGTGERALLTMVLFLHGGFWRAEYGREHTAPLAEALAAAGFAVCAPEYRRVGQQGGGWPGTFDDVAAAVDHLPAIVAEATGGLVDPDRIVLAGHSAGGQLALWAASRHRLPTGSPWYAERAAARGVVALAAVSDLAASYRWGLGAQAAGALMGGGPEQFPERYLAADPIRLAPAGVPVRVVHGMTDDRVPWHMSLGYARQARAAGIAVGVNGAGGIAEAGGVAEAGVSGGGTTCVLLPGTGHFEVIDPLSEAWPEVAEAFRRVADGMK